jgi:hypothetical protein
MISDHREGVIDEVREGSIDLLSNPIQAVLCFIDGYLTQLTVMRGVVSSPKQYIGFYHVSDVL